MVNDSSKEAVVKVNNGEGKIVVLEQLRMQMFRGEGLDDFIETHIMVLYTCNLYTTHE